MPYPKGINIFGCPHCKREDVRIIIMTNGDVMCANCLRLNGISHLTENDFPAPKIDFPVLEVIKPALRIML